jgi:CheY-like chemotaxis protein
MRKQTPVVLILEDNDQARFVIRAVLENAGYKVIDVENESQAIAVCGRTEQQIDLLISDVILSSAKGTEVAQRIVSLRPALQKQFCRRNRTNG